MERTQFRHGIDYQGRNRTMAVGIKYWAAIRWKRLIKAYGCRRHDLHCSPVIITIFAIELSGEGLCKRCGQDKYDFKRITRESAGYTWKRKLIATLTAAATLAGAAHGWPEYSQQPETPAPQESTIQTGEGSSASGEPAGFTQNSDASRSLPRIWMNLNPSGSLNGQYAGQTSPSLLYWWIWNCPGIHWVSRRLSAAVNLYILHSFDEQLQNRNWLWPGDEEMDITVL